MKDRRSGAQESGLRVRAAEREGGGGEGKGVYNFTTVKWKVNRTPMVFICTNPEAVLLTFGKLKEEMLVTVSRTHIIPFPLALSCVLFYCLPLFLAERGLSTHSV